MKVKDLLSEVKDKIITIIDPESVTEFHAEGFSYWNTIKQVCVKFGEREVLGIYNLDELGTVIEVA